jgi:hypothetical protein
MASQSRCEGGVPALLLVIRCPPPGASLRRRVGDTYDPGRRDGGQLDTWAKRRIPSPASSLRTTWEGFLLLYSLPSPASGPDRR